jgi:predicted membrane GTPase involved in stress response
MSRYVLCGFRVCLMIFIRRAVIIANCIDECDEKNVNTIRVKPQKCGFDTCVNVCLKAACLHLFVFSVSFVASINASLFTGMVIGENAKPADLDVNPCKAKKLSNVRSTGAEEKVSLTPAVRRTVEEYISYMDEDEVLEVTPKNIRLRKRILESGERLRAARKESNRVSRAAN